MSSRQSLLSVHQGDVPAPAESEPLLGRPGAATQKPGAPLVKNLWLGTGWIAQIGALILVLTVWINTFIHPTFPLVSPHPLLQSLGVYALLQSILILQPTTTPETKLSGARAHACLHILSFLFFLTGTIIIQVNKHVNHLAHFHSLHGYLGVLTTLLLLAQYLFGLSIWVVPQVWGGLENAKSLWKYHRMVGYAALLLLLLSVAAAARTDYNKGVLKVKMWSVLLAEALIVIGTVPRVHATAKCQQDKAPER
ncbi:putative cytochrome b561 protein [Thermochaetoides thermophila DSM 1495]|uniref:Putative cytochrome b561 protein n=1 Tax=Chaetomium thermophilum (strain DSM 1495 / CBS 144.50 / IMI 039719) TaxID=759272 RepID=G0RZF7_CHATD|nr:putative cytochrome b561 protein [Thermochaetoides thermophila DSM 1495]EGS23585.1 putative cytochrome b561 protein [Thermochaetoides thermophila DSM 1495]